MEDPGVVDVAREVPQGLGPFHQGVGHLRLPRAPRHVDRPRPQGLDLLGHRPQGGLLAGVEHQVKAFLGELQGEGLPDAPARPGEDQGLPHRSSSAGISTPWKESLAPGPRASASR